MRKEFLHQGKRPNMIATKLHTLHGNQRFQPLPSPIGKAPYHLSLDSVLSPSEIKKIDDNKSISFHCVGDTGGVKSPEPQKLVANGLESTEASFFYHLGDVVYYNGESEKYFDQFYDPYQYYLQPILAIPGNHDGDPLPRYRRKFARIFCKELLFKFNEYNKRCRRST